MLPWEPSVHSSYIHTLFDALPCTMCREPRGFAFVQFVDSYDAMEAQHRMNGQIFAGREISVVVAAETRKRPEEMRQKSRVRYLSPSHTIHFFLCAY